MFSRKNKAFNAVEYRLPYVALKQFWVQKVLFTYGGPFFNTACNKCFHKNTKKKEVFPLWQSFQHIDTFRANWFSNINRYEKGLPYRTNLLVIVLGIFENKSNGNNKFLFIFHSFYNCLSSLSDSVALCFLYEIYLPLKVVEYNLPF